MLGRRRAVGGHGCAPDRLSALSLQYAQSLSGGHFVKIFRQRRSRE